MTTKDDKILIYDDNHSRIMNNILIKTSVYLWLTGQTGWAEIGLRWPSHSEHIPKPTAGKYHHQLARPKPRTALLRCSLFYALIFFILFTWPLFLFLLTFIFFSGCAIIWELLVKHDLICHPVNISSFYKVYNNHNNNMPGVSFAGSTILEISSPNLEKLAFQKFRPGLAFRTTTVPIQRLSALIICGTSKQVQCLCNRCIEIHQCSYDALKKNWCGSFNKQYKTTIGP